MPALNLLVNNFFNLIKQLHYAHLFNNLHYINALVETNTIYSLKKPLKDSQFTDHWR